MSKEVPTTDDANWIRVVKNMGNHWPYFTHPDHPNLDMHLQGAFRVRWPDGTVTIEEIQAKDVRLLQKDGDTSVSGTFLYFSRNYNGMDLLHEPHEVELLDEEVARFVIDPSVAARASA